jgi:universal stress protein A
MYKRILLAVDLGEETPQLTERARAIARAFDAELEVLHVVEPVPLVVPDSPDVMAPLVLQSQDDLTRVARERLTELATRFGIAAGAAQMRVGNTKVEIVETARERRADLIVLGSRERHGLSMLIDFTEDSVLHHSPCDVLAIRVKN